jgi:aconitate hydratase
MGVLPLQFLDGQSRETLGLNGSESFDITGVPSAMSGTAPTVKVTATGLDGGRRDFTVKARIDTPQEAEYYRNGGILPYVLRQLVAGGATA